MVVFFKEEEILAIREASFVWSVIYFPGIEKAAGSHSEPNHE